MGFFEKVKLLASSLWKYVGPFISFLLKIGGEVAIMVAVNAVKRAEAEYGSGSGDIKRAFATELIIGDLQSKGTQVGIREAHDLIQTALRYLDK